ncbi:PREDICTED: cGMP-dependent protein kinase 1-like, partial [Rhagoletis zephyria]|uniref:cGMP-dependent protein kinase 1-like n=1 Tax=Rhagoletis zephyria TaxID=28612 RepID=UPI0008117E76
MKPRKTRLMGISAEPESSLTYEELLQTKFADYAKTDYSRSVIKNAILDNDFMKKLEQFQIDEITNCMYPVEYAKDLYIIKEGDIGSALYVIEEGTLEVSKQNNKFFSKMGPQKMFGELAILYNCTRTATVKALTDCKLWAIERQCFRTIMIRFGLMKQKEHIKFLKTVPSFSKLNDEVIFKIANVLEEHIYHHGDYIIRQGEKGDTFFIIVSGSVRVTINEGDSSEGKLICTQTKGEFFGERALQGEETRSANIIAESPIVTCLVTDRDSFKQLISNLDDVKTKRYDQDITERKILNERFAHLQLKDLRKEATLGVGGFGR